MKHNQTTIVYEKGYKSMYTNLRENTDLGHIAKSLAKEWLELSELQK
jgi:hypothetical protein